MAGRRPKTLRSPRKHAARPDRVLAGHRGCWSGHQSRPATQRQPEADQDHRPFGPDVPVRRQDADRQAARLPWHREPLTFCRNRAPPPHMHALASLYPFVDDSLILKIYARHAAAPLRRGHVAGIGMSGSHRYRARGVTFRNSRISAVFQRRRSLP